MKGVRLLLFFAVAGTGALLGASASAAAPAKQISIEYRGPLNEAVKKIAAAGGINLVASGDLKQEAEVYLKDVSPEEALRTVAAAYHLRIDQSGSIWTLRPMTEAERLAQPPPAPPAPPAPPTPAGEPQDSETATAPEAKEEPSPSERATREAADALQKSGPDRAKQKLRQMAREQRKRIREMTRRNRHPGSNDRVAQGSLTIDEGETVHSATALGGSLLVNGTVTGDAASFGGSLSVNGHVAGDATAIGGSVHLGPNAVVDGDVVAIGGEVSKEEGAEIGGDQTSSDSLTSTGITSLLRTLRKDAPNRSDRGGNGEAGHASWLHGLHFAMPSFFLWFALLFAVGFMLMVFAPNRMHQIESDLKNEPLKCALAGFVGFIAVGILVFLLILLALTIVGLVVSLPLLVVVPFLTCLGVAMGMSAVANEIGMRLPFFRGRKTQAIVLAVGTLVLLLVAKVPVIGPLAIAVLMTLAFGAAIRTRFGQAPKGVPQPI
jgi:hypothetical protein